MIPVKFQQNFQSQCPGHAMEQCPGTMPRPRPDNQPWRGRSKPAGIAGCFGAFGYPLYSSDLRLHEIYRLLFRDWFHCLILNHTSSIHIPDDVPLHHTQMALEDPPGSLAARAGGRLTGV